MHEFPAGREIRYQGAVVDDGQILLIKHAPHPEGSPYWLIPGGGIEGGESEVECVQREVKEETNLDVEVIRLILDEPGHPEDSYRRMKTFLCKPIGGEASPGYEPELGAASVGAISEVKWFDLGDMVNWDPLLVNDPFTYPQMKRIREALGYRGPRGPLHMR